MDPGSGIIQYCSVVARLGQFQSVTIALISKCLKISCGVLETGLLVLSLGMTGTLRTGRSQRNSGTKRDLTADEGATLFHSP